MFFVNSKNQKVKIFYINSLSKLEELEEVQIKRIHFDTRLIQENDFFIALKGQRDGHDFVLNAFQNSAEGTIIETSKFNFVFDQIRKENIKEKFIILTENTNHFLQESAKIQREQFKGNVYAIVGSNGKTSTKDLLGKMLKFFYKNVYITPGNWNNEIGVPITLLNMPHNAEVLVLELGMNHPGEIQKLSEIIRPHFVLVPSIGREHMEFFSNLEEVANSELEIIEYIQNKGYLFYPTDAPLMEWLKEKTVEKNIHLILYNLSHEFNDLYTENSFIGILKENKIYWRNHILENSKIYHIGMLRNFFLCYLAIYVSHFDILEKKFREFLEYISQLSIETKQRFQLYEHENTIFIDDTYNANPDSFISAIESMRDLFPQERLGCIAGHMAELGHFSKQGHLLVGETLRKHKVELIAICGNKDVKFIQEGLGETNIPYFENSEILATKIAHLNLQQYKAILIKGSRSSKMENILKELLGEKYV